MAKHSILAVVMENVTPSPHNGTSLICSNEQIISFKCCFVCILTVFVFWCILFSWPLFASAYLDPNTHWPVRWKRVYIYQLRQTIWNVQWKVFNFGVCYWHSRMNMADCPVCCRYIFSHSKFVTFGICKYVFHLKCISLNTEEQSYITTQKQSCTSCITEIFPFNFIENDKIFLAEINKYDLKSRVIELSDVLFKPYEMNSDDFYSPICETDPDINFYNEINYQIGSTCNYYIEGAISSIFKNRYNFFPMNHGK